MTAMTDEQQVRIAIGQTALEGNLTVPDRASGIVVFAHGSGSGRHSPRNQFVAEQLVAAGLATLLIDLLTEAEEEAERYSRHLRFDIQLLADRLVGASAWLSARSQTSRLPLGYFGASTGGGAALVASARQPERVSAVVSRGGRPDLADEALPKVTAPTLLIVGGDDDQVIEMNEWALARLGSPVKELEIIPGATHLFEEPGKLDAVARLAAGWFTRYLRIR
jgi:putative phosphoribosyl transferase